MQLVSILFKIGNIACDDYGVGAQIKNLYDASTDSQSSLTAHTWGAHDVSPGGSIYVQNKQKL